MLPRPLACCPAVRRHVCAQPDVIWITEDILSRSFQRFCFVTRSFTRNGSSVPGPLESCKRLGRRRMANLTEAVMPPPANFGVIWGFGGNADRDQWRWEAPQTRQPAPRDEVVAQFPPWLSSFEPVPLDDLPAAQKTVEPSTSTHEKLSIAAADNINIFRKSLKASPADQVRYRCEAFNLSLKQDITLGLLSMDVIASSLKTISEDIQSLCLHKEVMEPLRFSFYAAVWSGIKACKVLRSVDLGRIPNTSLSLLAQISITRGTQALAIEIIQAATSGTMTDMTQGIVCLVKAWVPSWVDLVAYGQDKAIQSENRDEDALWSLEQSVGALSRILAQLPRDLACKIIRTCTNYVIKDYFANFVGPTKILRRLRYSWLSAIANTPRVDDDLLIEIWTKMDFGRSKAKDCTTYIPSLPRVTMHEGCRLLLDFWISHDQIKAADGVRASFETAIEQSRCPDYVACLLLAIDEHTDLCWKKARDLFRFLRRIKKPQAIYHTLRLLRNHNFKFPASYIAMEVRDMTPIDVRCALNIYKLYHTIRYDNTPLLLDGCPELISGMINSDQFAPAESWGALGIPLYNPRRLSLSSKSLTKARIKLVHEMALEFAQADCRSNRVALRNVMQCAMYLRRHRVPVSTDLSRAFSYAGITRELLGRHWVGTKKALWILDLMRQAEGDAVAGGIENAVHGWRNEHIKEQQRARREGNPLRVGAID